MRFHLFMSDRTLNGPDDASTHYLGEHDEFQPIADMIQEVASNRWGGQTFMTEDPATGFFDIIGVRSIGGKTIRIHSQDRSGMTTGIVRGEFLIVKVG